MSGADNVIRLRRLLSGGLAKEWLRDGTNEEMKCFKLLTLNSACEEDAFVSGSTFVFGDRENETDRDYLTIQSFALLKVLRACLPILHVRITLSHWRPMGRIKWHIR